MTVKCFPASRRKDSKSIGGQPVGVVHDAGGIPGAIEVEESCELLTDPVEVRLDLLGRQQDPLLRFPARIANHPGAAADNRDRRMAETLEPGKRHHLKQRPDMEARGRRIEADVRGHPLFGEHVGKALGGVVHQAAPLEFRQ